MSEARPSPTKPPGVAFGVAGALHPAGAGNRIWLAAVITLALLALAACSRGDPKEKFQAADITGVAWGRDFHLVDPGGVPRSLADYRGKVVMLFFGYTNCPDECPTTLAKMAQAVDRLGADGQRVQGLFVTVDPARDSPAVLARYVPAFHPTFVGLSADQATTAATVKDFKLVAETQKPDDRGFYTVDHSSGIFVFDTQGRLRVFMGAKIWVDAMVHDLKLLLNEGSAKDRS
jgi:protein SCO1/2